MTREKFFKRVEKTDSCWIWTGYRNRKGYGQTSERVNGQVVNLLMHRYSYELHKGPIPNGLQVRHQCARPSCVNPDHLLVGTALENWHDVPAERRSQIRRDIWAKIPQEQRSEMLKARWAKFTPEQHAERGAKIAAAKIGKKLSPEHIEKLRLAKLGKPANLSAETRAKKSASMKAAHARFTPEQRAALSEKLSASQKGKSFSPEHLANLRAAHAARRKHP